MTEDLNLRESWLNRALDLMRPRFEELGSPLPEKINVSVGWSKGAKSTTVGVCWPAESTADGSVSIFMTPERDGSDVIGTLGTLCHEANHSSDNCASAHKGHFAKLNRQLGFTGKPTSSEGKSDELVAWLQTLADELGPFPHVAVVPVAKDKTQKTYMVKVTCNGCGYTVRTTKKWLETATPTCPDSACENHSEDMEVEEK